MAMNFKILPPSIAIGILTMSMAAAQTPQTPPTQTPQAPERSRTQGLEETDRFVKAGEDLAQEVAGGKMQVQKTLDAYNALVANPTKNMKGDYKKLLKAMDTMNHKADVAREKIEAMQKTADLYFSGRSETVASIQDADLKKQAQGRLADSQKQFADVLQSLRDGGQALEPFRKHLADQITYLGSDLTPSAMTSLKPQAEKLNSQGSEVLGKVDEAIAKANRYFHGLRSTES
jgi:hypothetical protein